MDFNPLERDEKFRYLLLNRMQEDFEYYLGHGHRDCSCLWAGDEREQIALMKNLWDSFPEGGKPEWLTMEKILSYEERMLSPQNQGMGDIQL